MKLFPLARFRPSRHRGARLGHVVLPSTTPRSKVRAHAANYSRRRSALTPKSGDPDCKPLNKCDNLVALPECIYLAWSLMLERMPIRIKVSIFLVLKVNQEVPKLGRRPSRFLRSCIFVGSYNSCAPVRSLVCVDDERAKIWKPEI